MATWEADIRTALESLGGTATLTEIYGRLLEIRGPAMPRLWKNIIQRKILDLSSDSNGYKGGRDVFFAVHGKGQGVWGLREFAPESPIAFDLSSGEPNPGRVPQHTYRVLRDTRLARQLKLLHRNRCQLCGLALAGRDGSTYAEAHHVIPLGAPHHGSDTPGNIIVVCPNHHAQCDMGAIPLLPDTIRTDPIHTIDKASLDYHNTHIAGSASAQGA